MDGEQNSWPNVLIKSNFPPAPHSRISSSAAAQSKRFDIGDIPYVQRRRQSIYRGEGGATRGGGNAGRTAAEGEFYNAPDGNPGQAIHREVDRCEQKSQILSWEGLNSASINSKLSSLNFTNATYALFRAPKRSLPTKLLMQVNTLIKI